jgi:hypothetical protein
MVTICYLRYQNYPGFVKEHPRLINRYAEIPVGENAASRLFYQTSGTPTDYETQQSIHQPHYTL